MVIWLIGLSGAGKTTLGTALHRHWQAREPHTVLIDGDEIRRLFGDDRHPDAYTLEGRRRNARRITALCEWLDGQGINVVCCILSIFPDLRRDNRARFSRYFEVYLRASLEALAARDDKGLYAAALRGEMRNVVGVDLPFEPPTDADMTLDTGGELPDVEALAAQVLKAAQGR